jgi:hypothetical protein
MASGVPGMDMLFSRYVKNCPVDRRVYIVYGSKHPPRLLNLLKLYLHPSSNIFSFHGAFIPKELMVSASQKCFHLL